MGSLTLVEKRKFESLFEMSNGYVLQLQKSELISIIVAATGQRPQGIDDPSPPSRARILRNFWDTANDSQVADVLNQLVDCFEQESRSNDLTRSQALVANCREVIKRLATSSHQPSHLETVMNVGDMEGIQKALNRIRSSVDSDPDLAIGSSKELIESVCKTILDDRSVVIKDSIGYTELTREAFSTLSLTPDNIPQSTRAADEVKRMLANLNSIVRQIEAIRDLYGTGHGRHAKAKGLQPRHARLVSGCAEVLCIFLWESHTRKKP